MADQEIDPSGVLAPTQLLAAVLVFLVVSVPAFITGAATVSAPGWVPGMFAVAAVADVPLTLLFVFRLLTKHRPNLVNDEIYERVAMRASTASRQLDESLTQAGVDTRSLITGTATADRQVREALAELESLMPLLRDRTAQGTVAPDVELNLAKALMAEHRWAEAAERFDRYINQVDADWDVHFLQGAAYANARGGASSDLSALRAYNEAISVMPDDIDGNRFARTFAYRGAVAKRLGKYEQAEADLILARRHATRDYERTDIAYNLAAVYAMSGRREEALAELRQLRDLGGINLILGHVDDYFRTLREDPDFQQVIGFPRN